MPPSSKQARKFEVGSKSLQKGPAMGDGTAGDSSTDCIAACGGPAVHGDWYLGGNGRAVEDYVNQAREFLEYSRIYLADGHLHQASEKGWGAAAHMAKAVALTQGWDYSRHADFHVVMLNAAKRLGIASILPLKAVAEDLHGNFYRRKRFLAAETIDFELRSVAELLDALAPLATAA